MRGLWGFMLSARPWLIGIVVWLVVVTVVHTRNPGAGASVAVGLLLTCLVGVAGLVRVLWPMRTYANPPKLVAAGRPYDIHTYTGRVGGASKTSFTTFQAESSVSENPVTGDLSHRLSTSQQTTVQDDLTLHGADGTQHNVQVRGVNLAVGPGQLVSAAWAVRPGRGSGRYVMFRNHTTGHNSYPFARLWWLATGFGAVVYLLCMWLGAILLFAGGYGALGAVWFIVVPLVYIGLGYYRAIRFRGSSRALADFLDEVAATFGPIGAAVPEPLVAPVIAQSPVPASVPPPPPAVSAPPGWFPDPTARHEHRYWNGGSWTDQVADVGVPALDPI